MIPDTVDSRLARLERSHRRLRAAALVLVAALLLAWARAPGADADVVRARRLQLVDAAGHVWIDLRHDSTETGMFIMDAAGDVRVGAAQFAHGGGGFALHGPAGRGAAVMNLKGTGSFTVYDTAGTRIVRIPAAQP